MQYSKMKIDKRLCAFLTFTFIICTIGGTLFHEFGHYLVLKLLGHDAIIRYNSTHPLMANGQLMTNKEYYLMILGGPLQTMITGTLGFIILIIDYKNIKSSNRLSFFQWLFIFITLFWLRQLATSRREAFLFCVNVPGRTWRQSEICPHADFLHPS